MVMGGPRERWLPGPGLPGPPKGPSANRTSWLEITGRGATWSKNWVLKFWSCFCNLGRRAACGANLFSRPRLLLVCPHYHCRHRQVPRVLSRQSALGHSWSCEIQTWGSPWIALSSSLHPKRRSFPHPNPLSPGPSWLSVYSSLPPVPGQPAVQMLQPSCPGGRKIPFIIRRQFLEERVRLHYSAGMTRKSQKERWAGG